MGEIVSLSLLTSPYFEPRKKSKCIKHIENPRSLIKLLSKIQKVSKNCSLSENFRLTPSQTYLSQYLEKLTVILVVFLSVLSNYSLIFKTSEFAIFKVIDPVPEIYRQCVYQFLSIYH